MLTNITLDTISQLRAITDQLTQGEYTKKLPILNHSSMGQHVRHVLEFYICLSQGIKSGVVNYNQRCRNLSTENDPNYANIMLDELLSIFGIQNIEERSLLNVTEFNGVEIETKSSVAREMVYLIEHSIHHYAIIAIALRNEFKHIDIPANFGVAYSTTKHKSEAVAGLAHNHH